MSSPAARTDRAASVQHPRLTVAHVLAPARFGGLERVVRALAAGHSERGHRVHVIHVIEVNESLVPIDFGSASTVETHVVRVKRRRYWRERAEVRALCRAHGVQIVHTHGYRPDVIDSGVAHSIGAGRVTTVHGFTGGGFKNRMLESAQVAVFRRFDAVVSVSAPLMQALENRGVPREVLHLIPNAWVPPAAEPLTRRDARAALGVADADIAIGWVGRLSSEKAADTLLDALTLTPPGAFTAAFLGDGPLLAALRERAAVAGISGSVRWCGAVDEASRFFPAFDVFVLSSRTEGTPIVLFEAMAAGVPIVATRVGGVPDVVSEKEARLVPPDDPRALADALLATISDRHEANRRSAAATARLRSSYAATEWLDRYESLYRRTIDGRSKMPSHSLAQRV